MEKTFVKITNRDIYDMLMKIKESNTKDHERIIIHQQETNGKVKLNRWIASTALSLVIIAFGLMFS